MSEQRLLVDSQEAAALALAIFPGLRPIYCNGMLPDEIRGAPHVLVFGADPAWVNSIEKMLRDSGSPIVRPGVGNFMEIDRENPAAWLRERVAPFVADAHPIRDAAKGLSIVPGHPAAPDSGVQGGSSPTGTAGGDISADNTAARSNLPERPEGLGSDDDGYLRDKSSGAKGKQTGELGDLSDADMRGYPDEEDAAESAQRSIRTASALKSAAHEEAQSTEWGDPADFWSASPPIPFDPAWILPTIRPFVTNQAGMVGCDPGLTYLQALGFAAGCLSDDIRVRVRPLQDWAESARLWVCVVGEPGDGKSPSMSGIMRESRELNMDIAQTSKNNAAAYKDEFDLYELERKAWLQKRQNMDASKPAGPRPIAPPKPVNEMLYFNSTTSEGLLEQQEATTRGTMLYADEMLGWIFGMDQYKASGKGNDKQFWLSSWDGAEFVGVLVGKLRTIPNTGVTIIGGSQPSAIRRASTKLNLDADGLLQRIIVYNSQGDADEDAEQPLDRDAAKRWRGILHNLYYMKTHLDHCVFSEKSHAIRKDANDWIRNMRSVTAFPVAARQAISKWKGYLPRLALTLHAIEAADNGREVIPATIEEHTMACAWAYMRDCIWPHTLAFYNGLLDFGDETASTRVFAEFVLARDIRTIKPHRLTSTWSHYRRLKSISERKEFWARVEQAGWVRPCGTFDRAGGISREYEINPAAFDGRFAKQISAATEAAERYREAMHPAMTRAREPGED